MRVYTLQDNSPITQVPATYTLLCQAQNVHPIFTHICRVFLNLGIISYKPSFIIKSGFLFPLNEETLLIGT